MSIAIICVSKNVNHISRVRLRGYWCDEPELGLRCNKCSTVVDLRCRHSSPVIIIIINFSQYTAIDVDERVCWPTQHNVCDTTYNHASMIHKKNALVARRGVCNDHVVRLRCTKKKDLPHSVSIYFLGYTWHRITGMAILGVIFCLDVVVDLIQVFVIHKKTAACARDSLQSIYIYVWSRNKMSKNQMLWFKFLICLFYLFSTD